MADLRANGADGERDLHSSDLGGHAPDAVRHEAPLLQQQHGAGGAAADDAAAAALGASASKAVPIFLTIGAAMGAFAFGLHIGYSSPNEDAIQTTVGLSQSQADLMFSLLNAGAMVGCLSAGSIATLFGPKRALLFNSLPYVAASVVFAFWDTYAGLCIGRVLAGVAVGFASVLVPLYVAEISPAALRGALGCVNQLMICSGITAANIIGLPTVSDVQWWKTQMMLYLIPIGVQVLVLFVYAPESPTWLVKAGQIESARAALRRLRGSAYNVDAELDLIRGALQSSPKLGAPANTKGDRSTSVRIDDVIAADHDHTQAAAAGLVAGPGAQQSSIVQQLLQKKALRPLVVGLGLVLIQQWSGINAVMFNSAQLFATKGATAITTEAIEGAIAVNSVQIAFTLLAVLTMSRRGRRFFLLLSTLGMAASSVALGGVFYADAASGWKIALVCVYLAFFAMGVGPVVWLVASEIFPSAVRATALGIVVVVNWGSSFAVTASFNPMNDALGDYGVFWFYGGVLLAGAAFVYAKLPETKDKTLEQIEHTFASD